MEIKGVANFVLHGLEKKNIILGKNGCGKSYLLKRVEEVVSRWETFGNVRYISPERGGLLRYEANIEQNVSNNPSYMSDSRRKNQASEFRQQSATLFRRLELLELREIERDHGKPDYVRRTFDATVEKLNTLLDRVRLIRDPRQAFSIVERDTGNPASPDEISSGEAELISLGIEILAFVRESVAGKVNLLLVDEPDVHLHPDLQDRLARFIVSTLSNEPSVTLLLATHSTALLAALADEDDARVAFMKRGDTTLSFKSISEIDRMILPIFGAYPLSNVFNDSPILLVEGEDDERIWQSAVRSSKGRLRCYPCAAGSVDRLLRFEKEVNSIIEAVYDDALGYSLRDRDEASGEIEDLGRIVRMRLGCRAAENLMLSNDVLRLAAVDWPAMQTKIGEWVSANNSHQYHAKVCAFVDGGLVRKQHDLKDIRNILIGLISNRPWEVLVGQAIAELVTGKESYGEGSLRDYLGAKVCDRLLKVRVAAL